jgi:hypothetical protein
LRPIARTTTINTNNTNPGVTQTGAGPDPFRPVQRAYGRAKRAYAEFASRHGLNGREFTMPSPGMPSTGVKGFIQNAVDAVERAERELVALQESPIAIEVGDIDLRAGLTEVRRLIDGLSQHARAFVSTFGR